MTVRILEGDAMEVLRTLPAESVHCCVTSPPYWGLRDYGVPPSIWGGDADCSHSWGDEIDRTSKTRNGSIGKHTSPDARDSSGGRVCRRCGAWRGALGLEPTPELFVDHVVLVFREVRRVLRADGTLWLNIGDCYAANSAGARPQSGFPENRNRRQEAVCSSNAYRGGGVKGKDLIGVPWMLAFALRADGWYLRSEIIWHKPNPMPESVTDRPTKAHEQVFLLTKSAKYFYDAEAIREKASGVSGGACFGSQNKATKTKDGGHAEMPGGGFIQSRKLAGKEERAKYDQVRNIRSVWTIPTFGYPEAHFATFPPKLAEPCIKAGTSEHGCCPECGAAWSRLLEKRVSFQSGSGKTGNPIAGKNGSTCQGGGVTGDIRKGPVVTAATRGWEPTCQCNAGGPIPCTVLDPFGGAGTTGLVADRLGRDAVLIELNHEYANMARRRIATDAGMFAEVC